MTNEEFNELVLAQYRTIVAAAKDDGVKRAEAVETIATEVRHRLAVDEGFELPDDIEGRIERIVHVRDEASRRQQVASIEWVQASLLDLTILGKDDPIMSEVALVGSGVRKAWRWVGIEDLTAMTGVKMQHAADATSAANEFQKAAQVVIRALLNKGVDATLNDLAQ